MKVWSGNSGKIRSTGKVLPCVVAVCLFMAFSAGVAQRKPAAKAPINARQVLVQNARALEARGRVDMAIQVWRQILLSDPGNTEALAGLARDYKLAGNAGKSSEALERLRAIDPNDPNIAKIAALKSTQVQNGQLRQAGELARQGKSDEAMRTYRELYGDHPPDGDIALAYYETLYGTAGGKEKAISAMRALMQRNPGDERFAVRLGTMLTYDAKTRGEGIRILQAHAKDPEAQTSLRQALVWNAANPASAAALRQYLKEHPQDEELAGRLKENESALARMNTGIARTTAERAAFAALDGRRLEEAERRFTVILSDEPSNPRAEAGMGFLRMRQNNFSGAISYLTQAEQRGFKISAVEDALATSRFWLTLGEATQAAEHGQYDEASAKYRQALVMRPRNPEALNGLAGLLVRERQYEAAAGVYEQLVKSQPESKDGWRGLFLSYALGGQTSKAEATLARIPAAVKTALARDPEYLRTLARVYRAENRPSDAARVLNQALSLPFSGDRGKVETRLEYAGILTEARRFDQAVQAYAQILDEDAGNRSAWMGLVSAHHELAQDSQAIADVEKMPPAAYEEALSDPGFLALLGSIYAQANQPEIAQSLLERAVKIEGTAGGHSGLALELQLAAIYLQRGNTAQAYEIYRRILKAHPESTDAWKGLIAGLQASNHSAEAVQQIALIPPSVRRQLESDIAFVESEASLYAAVGDTARAAAQMSRIEAYYAQLKTPPPANIAVQNAWLLYNTKNDRALYPALMRLGGREDLTIAEREAVETIWANWSVRRAGVAYDSGNTQRAAEILDTAMQAFPDNLAVRKLLAGGYLKIGHAKVALSIYRNVPLESASVGDYQVAVGAALAVSDKPLAESWLRQALARYPADASILSLAARYEQARGDSQRAASYWRASLAAMPPISATDKLAHELAYPDANQKLGRVRTPADLGRLLNPDDEPYARTTKLPPLPAYGADPYEGSAPVVLTAPRQSTLPAAQQNQWNYAPTPAAEPAFSAPVSNPLAEVSAAQAPVYYPSGEDLKAHSSLQPSQENAQLEAPDSLEAPALVMPHDSDVATKSDLAAKPRITLHPMNDAVAHAQAQSAGQADEQTKEQPMAESAPVVSASDDTPATQSAPAEPAVRFSAAPAPSVEYNVAQYTPSAQEAASGASSASRRLSKSQQQAAAEPPAEPLATKPAKKSRKDRKVAATSSRQAEQVSSQNAVPVLPPPPPQLEISASSSALPAPAATVTDEQLMERNLPPLRGPYTRVQREPRVLTPRDEVEMQLHSIESGFSAWLGGTGIVNTRSGDLGYSRLTALEAPFEASMPLGTSARFTVVAKPVFLDSGQADGSSLIQLSTLGRKNLGAQVQPMGTLMTTDTNPPPQQNATGIGGEAQLRFPHLALAVGYTPAGFLVATITGRVQWKPENGPFTFNFSRDPVKETQLSYAGLRDPGSTSLGYSGDIWGGVVANLGGVQYARGDEQSGFYVGAGGGSLNGYHVEPNTRIDGNGGAYWRVRTLPEYGNLNIGANFFAMHYAHNESAFTYGMGGYFSPQVYFLANVPVTWSGHSGTRWHYNILGSFGLQAFQEDLTALFPAFTGIENVKTITVDSTTYTDLALPAKTSVGANYDLRTQVAYRIGPHWFAGGFFGANNARDYSAISLGFSVRYLFREQPSKVAGPTGIFPSDGLRPFLVP